MDINGNLKVKLRRTERGRERPDKMKDTNGKLTKN